MTLYFLIACHNDAKPVIDYYGLKKDMAGGPFTIFTAHNVVLCLSGNGRANAAAATAYVLSRWGRDGLFVHLSTLEKEEGVFYPHTITDREELVYQEMLYKPPSFVREGIIEDGEGVYAFLSASKFLPLKQIIILRAHNLADEGILSWLETIHRALYPFGMMSFPISTWKKGHKITL